MDPEPRPAHQERRRALWYGAALIVALVVLVVAWRTVSFLREPPQQRGRFQSAGGVQPVGVAVIGRGDVRVTLHALGAVTPLATVTVVSQISGYVLSVPFKEGQLVHKGDLLAQIDSRPYEVALEQDQAQLERDEATLEQAKMDLKRYETLANQTSIAKQTYEDQVYIVKTDQGAVDYDRALVKAQQLNLTYCRIVSPVDGRVGLRLVDPGNYVQSGSTTGITTVTTLKPTTVVFPVAEDSLPQVLARARAGGTLPVTVFDRANATPLASGEFFAVDAQVSTTTGTVNLRARFDNGDEKLFPQQFVNVELLLDTLRNVVTVPVAAVQRGAPGTYVYLVDQSNVVAVHTVTLGPQDGTVYAVTDGLADGDRVVTDGADRLRDGARVSIPGSGPAAPKPPRAHGAGPGGTGQGSGNWQHRHRPGSSPDGGASAGAPPSGNTAPPAGGANPAGDRP